jgi:hypothetical protein
MLTTKKIKMTYKAVKFSSSLNLPEAGQTIIVISNHHIWPIVKKIWLAEKQPLYICTFSLSNEIGTEINKLVEQGHKLGALLIDASFERTNKELTYKPTGFIDNHAKIYVCGNYTIYGSANLNKGSRQELTQITNNAELAKTMRTLVFGVI